MLSSATRYVRLGTNVLIIARCFSNVCLILHSRLRFIRRRCPHSFKIIMPSSVDWDTLSCSSSSSDSSLDDDQVNARLSPHWLKYRDLIFSKGYRLETLRDVRERYRRHGIDTETCIVHLSPYLHARSTSDDSALCKDPGLVWHDPFFYQHGPLTLISQKISSEQPAA